MKKKGDNAQLEKLLSELWMKQLDNELAPNDTMNDLNRMALVTNELTGRLDSIIADLEKKKRKIKKKKKKKK